MTLLQMSFSGAVMILAVTVLRALTIHRVPKKTFLVLWGAVLARLLLPFSFPSALSIYSLLGRNLSTAANTPIGGVLPPVSAEQTTTAMQHTASTPAPGIPVWTIIWAVGTILCAAFFAVTYVRCRREFQMSLPVQNEFIGSWLQAHTLRRKLSVRQSDRIASPLTFGVLHPVILLPKKTDFKDETALQYVLEHEFVHIQRLDICAKLLLIAALCVHWFDPLVWVMYVLANRDIELSCDETVIRRFGNAQRASYAKVLIRMEEVKSGFAPLCNNFSKNAIEERITAIMKTKKITVVSLILAAALVVGTVTVFATSAQTKTAKPATAKSNTLPSEMVEAVESGDIMKPSAEYIAAGITMQNNSWSNSTWYYQKKPVAGIYDDNGDIYMNNSVDADGTYLTVTRDDKDQILKVSIVTKEQFDELVDRHKNSNSPASTLDDSTLMSYVNPDDGKTYYSFDDGKTFEPLTDAEFEARFPTPNVEWWTYDEYKAWLENEKVQLQSLLGETGSVNGQKFTWTQEKIDETIAMYEEILNDIKNGIMYSKSIDGEEDQMISYDPTDIATATETA